MANADASLLFLVLLILLRPTAAGPENHSVQQVLFFYSYLADEIVHGPGTYVIAPDCGAAKGVSRCNFNQFLEYIWKSGPRIDDGIPPTVTVLKTGEDVKDFPIDILADKVRQWKAPNARRERPKNVLGNIEGSRLVAGATEYYDALGRVGGPIGMAQRFLTAHPDPDRDWIVKNGQALAEWLYDLRFADLEIYRIPYVQSAMSSAGMDLKLMYGRTTQPGQQPWERINIPGTIRGQPEIHPDIIKEELYETLLRYRTTPGKKQDHFAAVRAAMRARVECACVV